LHRAWQACHAAANCAAGESAPYADAANPNIRLILNAFPVPTQRKSQPKGSTAMKKIEPSIPTPSAVKKPKAPTVTMRDLATTLSEAHDLPKKQVNAMLVAMVEDIAKHLKKGKRIRIAGLGILQVRKRPARIGRNPATGAAIKIKASKKIAFRASKDLKEAI
jgi:DNA-binding protein HU-beta